MYLEDEDVISPSTDNNDLSFALQSSRDHISHNAVQLRVIVLNLATILKDNATNHIKYPLP